MADDVARLTEAVPIETYVSRFVSLKRKGNNLWGLCPFHNEKTPSFSVAPDKGIFKCFGCGKGGDVISFVREYEKTDFRGALKILSEYSGIPLSGPSSSPQSERQESKKKKLLRVSGITAQWFKESLPSSPAETYLKSRKVSNDSINHFNIGYAPADYRFLENRAAEKYRSDPDANREFLTACQDTGLIALREGGESYNRFRDRLMFPITNLQGDVIAFGGRILNNEAKAAKYVNSPESDIFSKKKNLFHLYQARESIRKDGQAILVEGYFDVLGLYQAGFHNSVAPLGTAFTPEQARLLKRFTDRVILFFDNDTAGIEASYKSILVARKARLEPRVVITKEGTKSDPFDLAMQLSKVELIELLDNSRGELDFILWYFFRYRNSTSDFANRQKATRQFFEFLRTETESELEVSDYLRAAAQILDVERGVLERDYRNNGSPTARPAPRPEKRTENEEESRRAEREILAMLLWDPSLWEHSTLINEHIWNSQNAALTFGFLRDRLQSGEVIAWQNLQESFATLPDELSSFLAGLIIEFESDLRRLTDNEDDKPRVQLADRLRATLLDAARQRKAARLKELQSQLRQLESIDPQAAEETANEIFRLQSEISRMLASRRKLSGGF